MRDQNQPALFEVPGDASEVPAVVETGVEEFPLPDGSGNVIPLPWVSKNGKKSYKVAGRLLHSKEAVVAALSQFLDLLIAAADPQKAHPGKPRVRNTSRLTQGDRLMTKPEEGEFYKPCEYKGAFSYGPAGVEEMIGPTHLQKRLFAHAFSLARYYKVDRIQLTWSETAKDLGSSDKGISRAANKLKEEWGLFWFTSTQGARLGAIIRFPKHAAVPITSEQKSEVRPDSLRSAVPDTSEHSSEVLWTGSPDTSDFRSRHNIEIERKRDVVDENRRRALLELAATATDDLDLIEKLKPHFPEYNLDREFKRYVARRREKNLGISRETFVDWMLRAHRPLKKGKLNRPDTPPPEEVDPEVIAPFEKDFECYKLEKAAKENRRLWRSQQQRKRCNAARNEAAS